MKESTLIRIQSEHMTANQIRDELRRIERGLAGAHSNSLKPGRWERRRAIFEDRLAELEAESEVAR